MPKRYGYYMDKSSIVPESSTCPICNGSDVKKIEKTFWGGSIVPRFLNSMECQTCDIHFNGESGDLITNRDYIILSIKFTPIIVPLIVIILLAKRYLRGLF